MRMQLTCHVIRALLNCTLFRQLHELRLDKVEVLVADLEAAPEHFSMLIDTVRYRCPHLK